jgi:hypothetical protein
MTTPMSTPADTISALVLPDPLAVLVQAVLLGATSAAAGLALARVVTARRTAGEPSPTPVGGLDPERFRALFGDLTASVSMEAAVADDGPDRRRPAGAGAQPPRYTATPLGVRVVAAVVGVVAAGAGLAAALTEQISWTLAAVPLPLLLAVPVLIGSRRRLLPSALTGVALVGVSGVEFATVRAGLPLVLALIYASAVSVLLGSAALLAGRLSAPVTDDRTGAAPAAGRRDVVAPLTAVLVIGAGVAQFVLGGPRTAFDVVHTGNGVAAGALIGLPLLALAAWLVATRSTGLPRAAKLGRSTAGLLTLSLLAASLLAVLPAPLPAPEPGRPGLRPLTLGDSRLAVLVAPMRPGPNLVHVGDAGVDRGADNGHGAAPVTDGPALTVSADPGSDGPGVPLTTRPGAPGTWAVVDIPAGAGRLRISGYGTTADLPVDVGPAPATAADQAALTGADGPECASATLGALLAGGWNADLGRSWADWCPANTLTATDAGSLRDSVDFLADRGVPGIELVADDSGRGRAAAALVRREATRRQLPITDSAPGGAVVVVSGWSGATNELSRITRANSPLSSGGIVLAPWLLNGEVLIAAPVEIFPLTFDPTDPEPFRYALTVRAVFPREVPTASGYLRWAAVRGGPGADRATFYSAAAVFVPMATDIMGAVEGTQWYARGAINPAGRPRTPAVRSSAPARHEGHAGHPGLGR